MGVMAMLSEKMERYVKKTAKCVICGKRGNPDFTGYITEYGEYICSEKCMRKYEEALYRMGQQELSD